MDNNRLITATGLPGREVWTITATVLTWEGGMDDNSHWPVLGGRDG